MEKYIFLGFYMKLDSKISLENVLIKTYFVSFFMFLLWSFSILKGIIAIVINIERIAVGANDIYWAIDKPQKKGE